MDEVFDDENFVTQITYKTNWWPLGADYLSHHNSDLCLVVCETKAGYEAKYRKVLLEKGGRRRHGIQLTSNYLGLGLADTCNAWRRNETQLPNCTARIPVLLQVTC